MSVSSLTTYRKIISEQRPLEEAWFLADLEKVRSGDNDARLRILGSALRLSLAAAEARFHTRTDLLDFIQEANAALEQALTSFDGHSLQSFQDHVEAKIQHHLDVFAQASA